MRKIILSKNEYYHIYNRGVDKRVIFTTRIEYERFLAYLYLLNSSNNNIRPSEIIFEQDIESIFSIQKGKPLVAIGAYCLMPNHFHILATPLVDGGISKFMQRVQTAYTMYFNQKYKRSGSLLQGTYKVKHANTDEYLKYLFSYIHLNPAKLFDPKWKSIDASGFKKLKQKVEEYPYSSIGEYSSSVFNISNPYHFPKYFEKVSDFKSQASFWLTHKETFCEFREAKPRGKVKKTS